MKLLLGFITALSINSYVYAENLVSSSSSDAVNTYQSSAIVAPVAISPSDNVRRVSTESHKLQLVSASASSVWNGNMASNAIDGDYSSQWNSGSFSTRGISVQLAESSHVNQIKLLTEQSPAGETIHNIYANGSLIGVISGYTGSGQWLSKEVDVSSVTSITIETVSSPSWIAWREIEVFGVVNDIENELNRADENQCTTNPVNIATGNKFFIERDYTDSQNPLLNISRTWDSGDGYWAFNIAKAAVQSSDPQNYQLTFANGSKGTFIAQGDKWYRTENKPNEYLTKTANGDVIYHAPGNHRATFDSTGTLKSETKSAWSVAYDHSVANQVTIRDGLQANKAITIKYNANAFVESVILPDNGTIFYRYDDKGRLWQVENRGKLTTYFFEDTAWPLNITRVQDANGQTWKNISYYPDGRVHVSELNGGQERMTFTYPEVNTTQTTNALGKATTYTFVDLKGVKKVAKVEGHASTNCLAANQYYTYYPNGQIETKTDWKGVVTRFEYNDRHLESKRIEAAGTPEQRVITTTWHPELNLPATVTVGNQVTTYEYQTNGQLKLQHVSKVLK